MRSLRSRVRARPLTAAVAGITVLALLARLVSLGWRMAHQDEARVGYAVVQYVQSGVWEYNPVLHGPFVFQVNAPLFGLFGAGDFLGRLVVALVGGLLPATAYLFRTRLRDEEVVALAALFAANPFLLYYSRFMRSDVLVAGFVVATLGFAVRLLDTRDHRYLYAVAASLGLALTTKENVVVYLGIWVGSFALVVDYHLLAGRTRDRSFVGVLTDGARNTASWASRWRVPLALALVELLVILVAFYAPRPDIWQAFGNPTQFPGVVSDALLGSWEKLWARWVAGSSKSIDTYTRFVREFVGMLRFGALTVVGFAALGFVLDRYRGDGQRDFVAFATYWGAVSIPLYPYATDIMAPWLAVHVVTPLAIPAAVGLGVVYRRGRTALARDDRVGVGLAAVVLLLVGAQMGVTAVNTSYLQSQDPGEMVQYGQPDDHFKEELRLIEEVAANNDGGPDVAFYGNHFSNRLFRQPFPWYFAASGVETTTVTGRVGLVGDDKPPVVIAPSDDSARIQDTIGDVEPYLDNYTKVTKSAIVLKLPGNEVYATVYVRNDSLAAARSGNG